MAPRPASAGRSYGPHRAFGLLLRRFREAAGFNSAAALSRAAGLSDNYVSIIERGDARPKSGTIRKLAGALGLAPADRDSLLAAAKLSGEGADVRTAVAGPAIPGLVVWKYLPEPLYAVPHLQPELHRFDPDQAFADVVLGAASLLTWTGTVDAQFTSADADALRAEAERAYVESLNEASGLDGERAEWGPREAAADAARILPFARRGQLFSSRAWTRRAAAQLVRWDHCGGVPKAAPSEPAMLSIWFKSKGMNDRFGFEFAPLDLVRDTHDALVSIFLWGKLGLGETIGPVAPESLLPVSELRAAVDYALAHDPTAAGGKAEHGKRPGSLAVVLRRHLETTGGFFAGRKAAFALRLYELPELAASLPACSREQVAARVAEFAAAQDQAMRVECGTGELGAGERFPAPRTAGRAGTPKKSVSGEPLGGRKPHDPLA